MIAAQQGDFCSYQNRYEFGHPAKTRRFSAGLSLCEPVQLGPMRSYKATTARIRLYCALAHPLSNLVQNLKIVYLKNHPISNFAVNILLTHLFPLCGIRTKREIYHNNR